MSFETFFMKESYKKIKELGDKLDSFKTIIDWERFRPIIAKVYYDNKETGGRPHTDELVIVRALVLQAIYNLSDPELEFQCHDRISFRNFIGLPESVPDFSTIWNARERLHQSNLDKEIWNELQRQISEKGLIVKKGVIQDATIIEADAGKKKLKNGKEKEGSQIDKDGTFTAKNNQVHFGYKDHVKVDIDNTIVRSFQVTTASVHDSRVDLARNGDKLIVRDKGYFGSKISARNVTDLTMRRAVRGRKLTSKDKKYNWKLSRIRSPGERVFAVVKIIFDGWHTTVKTIERVRVKEMFKYFAFNLYQLRTVSG